MPLRVHFCAISTGSCGDTSRRDDSGDCERDPGSAARRGARPCLPPFTLGLAGLRPSEAVALTVADFDPAAHTLRVSKAIAEVNGVRVQSKGKTRAANRTVTVPPSLARELRAHVEGRNY